MKRRAVRRALVAHTRAARQVGHARRQTRALSRTLAKTQLVHMQGARSARQALGPGGNRGRARSRARARAMARFR